ncbi:MAG: Cell division integral membrane protein, YggT and half-length relatives, partial [uncultured Sphingomonas sp.]
ASCPFRCAGPAAAGARLGHHCTGRAVLAGGVQRNQHLVGRRAALSRRDRPAARPALPADPQGPARLRRARPVADRAAAHHPDPAHAAGRPRGGPGLPGV